MINWMISSLTNLFGYFSNADIFVRSSHRPLVVVLGPNSDQVGYWLKEIFTHLNSSGASKIKYGGKTYAPSNMVSPPMDSGRLPKEFFSLEDLRLLM